MGRYTPEYWRATDRTLVDKWLDDQVEQAVAQYTKRGELILFHDGAIHWCVPDYSENTDFTKVFQLGDLTDYLLKMARHGHVGTRQLKEMRRVLRKNAKKVDKALRRAGKRASASTTAASAAL